MAPPDAKLARRRSTAELEGRLGVAIISGAGGRYQGPVRTLGVVAPSPSLDQNPGFRQGVQDLPVK